MNQPTLPAEIAAALVNSKAYAEWDDLHKKFAWARANMPLGIAENDQFSPFWAVTRHADILEVSRNNALFSSAVRSTMLLNLESETIVRAITPKNDGHLARTLVQMDAPDHMKYRLLTQSWFMPKNLRTIEARIREIARDAVEKMLAMGGECDFAKDVAAGYPLHVIMSILGIPPEDEPRMLMLTQQLFGASDPEINRARAETIDPEQFVQMLQFVLADFDNYFAAVTADRRANPRDDLATVIATSKVNGAPIPDREANGYYMLIATAGHDTTTASTAGAIMELAKNPALFARYRDGSADTAGLIEEAIRWTTPVKHFMRNAAQDAEVAGQKIAKGDMLMLSYYSANRDEAVWEDPYSFRVDRPENDHLAFGHGAHVCLGQFLARMELRLFWAELLPHVKSLGLDGEATIHPANFINGPNFIPLVFETA